MRTHRILANSDEESFVTWMFETENVQSIPVARIILVSDYDRRLYTNWKAFHVSL